MDTLFRLVSLQASEEQHQSASYNSRSTTSSGSRSSSHHTNASYNYYHHHSNSSSGGGGGGQYYYSQQPQQSYYLEPYQEDQCGGNAHHSHHLYMDEDFSSSSSSRHFHSHGGGAVQQPPTSSATPTAPTPPLSTSSTAAGAGHALFEAADLSFPPDLNLDFSSPASSSGGGGGTASSPAVGGGGGGRWASQLLLECARAVATRESQRVQQLMWMLNELASPYGDVEQKLASYFLQGLFARLTSSGPRTLRTLAAATDRNTSFDSTRRTALRFQELSPWSSFGHVAANGAILESFLEAAAASSEPQRFHILDLSNTFCTQWPTLLEALATRSPDDTPHLSITTVVSAAPSAPTSAVQRVMREIGQRMEKFARLMGVPFRFRAVHHSGDLAELDLDALDLREGGATTGIAVNCINSLRGVVPGGARRRGAFAASLRRLGPRVVTVVEEEADLVATDPEASDEGGDTEAAAFLKVFGEGLRFFSAYMDSLEESFPKTSNERLALERSAGRAIVDLVSCPASDSMERRETAAAWALRLRSAGFSPVPFSDDVADDVRSLLRRYREGWSMREAGTDDSAAGAGVFLAWKAQPLVWASAWRP